MADYNAHLTISRDSMVEMLTEDDSEQTPYVLAELAAHFGGGSMTRYDDFANAMRTLDADQQDALKTFCAAIVETLYDAEAPAEEEPAA